MQNNLNSGFTSQEVQILKRIAWQNEEAIKALSMELAGKQDTLTAGANISIINNVISASGGGDGERLIKKITLTEAVDEIIITTDSSGNLFNLKHIRIFGYVPASGAESNNNGYINLATPDETGYPIVIGPVAWVDNGYNNFIYAEIFNPDDIPAMAHIAVKNSSNLLSGANVGLYVDTHTTYYAGFDKIRLILNSGNYPVGTIFYILGTDNVN